MRTKSFWGRGLWPYIQSEKLLAWVGGRVSALTVAVTEEAYDINKYEWSKKQSEDDPKHSISPEEFGEYLVKDLRCLLKPAARTKTTWLLNYWQWYDRKTLWSQLPINLPVCISISSCFLLRRLLLLFCFLFLLLQLLQFFRPLQSFLVSTVKFISLINIQ